jgi:hypothetical protein
MDNWLEEVAKDKKAVYDDASYSWDFWPQVPLGTVGLGTKCSAMELLRLWEPNVIRKLNVIYQLEVGVNTTVLIHTVCLAGLGLITCVLQYLTLNKLEMVNQLRGKIWGIYHSPAPRRLKTLDRLVGIQTGCFPEHNETLNLTASMYTDDSWLQNNKTQ